MLVAALLVHYITFGNAANNLDCTILAGYIFVIVAAPVNSRAQQKIHFFSIPLAFESLRLDKLFLHTETYQDPENWFAPAHIQNVLIV